jgi:hypothetical protein
MSTLSNRRNKRGFPILFTLSSLMVIVATGLLVFELVSFSRREEQLPSGVRVAGLNVGGLSKRDAVTLWESAYAQPITMYYTDSNGSHPIVLNPDQLGWRISSDPMLADVLASTETDGGFWQRFLNYLLGNEETQSRDIPLLVTYQENVLEEFLLDVARRYDNPAGTPGYDLQTLTTFPGEPGYALDIDSAILAVDATLRNPTDRKVNLPTEDISNNRPQMKTLESLLIDYLDSQGFIYDGQTTVASIFIMDLISGEEINILGDVAYSAASTIKVPIMIDFYRTLAFEPSQEEAWLLANSLLCSNNSSSNLIMQIIGINDIFAGIQSVTETAQYIGAKNTYITAPFYLGVEGQQLGAIAAPATNPNPNYNTNPDPYNQTTSEDMGTLFNLIYDCAEFGSGLTTTYPDGEITQRECRQMLELMSANNLERLLQGGVPVDARISHKNGWIFDTVGDSGVVYSPNGSDYVISVYLWEEAEFQDYEKLWPLVEEISRATWNYFNPENALIEQRDLPPTAQECEGNYLPPSPELVNLDDIDSWKSN